MDRLSAYQVTIDDIVRALQTENLEIPGGDRDRPAGARGAYSWAPPDPGEFDRHHHCRAPQRPHLPPDVALVEDGMADERSLSRLNGERASPSSSGDNRAPTPWRSRMTSSPRLRHPAVAPRGLLDGRRQ